MRLTMIAAAIAAAHPVVADEQSDCAAVVTEVRAMSAGLRTLAGRINAMNEAAVAEAEAASDKATVDAIRRIYDAQKRHPEDARGISTDGLDALSRLCG